MAAKTEELTEKDQLLAEIAALKEQLKGQSVMLSTTAEEGWLIETPNPDYSGVTAGVEFREGKAFIPAVPDETETVEGKKVTINRAKQKVAQLADDFGYDVMPVTAGEYKAIKNPEAKKPGSTLEELMREPTRIQHKG